MPDEQLIYETQSERRMRTLKSPIVYLIGTLYAGVVAGTFLNSMSEIKILVEILDKMAYLSFSFVFFINATSLVLFYIYLLSPLERDSFDFALTVTLSFLFVVAYLVTFLILPNGYLSYSFGFIGIGSVYLLAWVKYFRIFNCFHSLVNKHYEDKPKTKQQINIILDEYRFIRILKNNYTKTCQATIASFVIAGIIISGEMFYFSKQNNDSWLLSLGISFFAIYMIFTIVYNTSSVLDPNNLKKYEQSDNDFHKEFTRKIKES
ncbi:MAG: hypothetical protein PF638_05230 [Candidatus Delongbacteria bacterium]|jgi:hypothetical protein|nr:hypothetical protein [Candidatus Delongbacteria bacterium]